MPRVRGRPAGIAAARAAGMTVWAVTTTHQHRRPREAPSAWPAGCPSTSLTSTAPGRSVRSVAYRGPGRWSYTYMTRASALPSCFVILAVAVPGALLALSRNDDPEPAARHAGADAWARPSRDPPSATPAPRPPARAAGSPVETGRLIHGRMLPEKRAGLHHVGPDPQARPQPQPGGAGAPGRLFAHRPSGCSPRTRAGHPDAPPSAGR